MWRTCVVVVAVAALVAVANGKHVRKHVEGDEFVYIDKFCFSPGYESRIEGRVRALSNADGLQFALFTDEDGGWDAVEDAPTCKKKESQSKMLAPIEAVQGRWNKVTVQILEDRKPHFWYLAAIDCGNEVDMDVDIHLLNSGPAWLAEFSNDERELVFMNTLMFTVLAVVGALHLKGARVYVLSRTLHPIVSGVTVSLGLLLFSLLLSTAHHMAYAVNGTGAPSVAFVAGLVYAAFQVCMVAIIIILSKGWTISRIELTGRSELLRLLAVFTLLHFALFVWTTHKQFQPSTVYKYSTVPGVCIVLLRCAVWGWFLVCLKDTFLEEPNEHKKRLYVWLGALFSWWLLSLGVVVLIASAVEPCSRKGLVDSILGISDTLITSVFAFLVWPSRAARYFDIEVDPEFEPMKKEDNL